MRVMIDADGSLYRITDAIIARLKKKGLLDNSFSASNCKRWKWYEDHGITDDQFYATFDEIHADGTMLECSPYDRYTSKTVHELGWAYPTSVLTSKAYKHYPLLRKWMDAHKMERIPIEEPPKGAFSIPSKEKFAYGWSILIEDNPEMVARVEADPDIMRPGQTLLILNSPWNRDLRHRDDLPLGVRLVDGWKEVRELFGL